MLVNHRHLFRVQLLKLSGWEMFMHTILVLPGALLLCSAIAMFVSRVRSYIVSINRLSFGCVTSPRRQSSDKYGLRAKPAAGITVLD